MFGGVYAWSKILYENNISRKENEYMEETALKWSNISDAEKKELIKGYRLKINDRIYDSSALSFLNRMYGALVRR